MDSNDSREMVRLMRRLVEALERLSPPPATVAVAPADLKDVASAVRFHRDPRPDPDSDFPSSTTTREKFFAEGDR